MSSPGLEPQYRKNPAWYMLLFLALERQKQENQKFKAILSYIKSLKPAWDTGNPVSKPQSKNID